MKNTLIFPDGVRLLAEDEIPKSAIDRSDSINRLRNAIITPGFSIRPAGDEEFSHYAAINVDAPKIWAVFSDLCMSLLEPSATIILGEIDEEPVPVQFASVHSILAGLEPYKDRLAHDGFLQFGLISHQDGRFSEVFVAPTKHFRVWFSGEERFRDIMERHKLVESDSLEFLDEFPRRTEMLAHDRIGADDIPALVDRLCVEIAAISES